MDEPGNEEPGMDDLLAAYRERKRKALQEAQAALASAPASHHSGGTAAQPPVQPPASAHVSPAPPKQAAPAPRSAASLPEAQWTAAPAVRTPSHAPPPQWPPAPPPLPSAPPATHSPVSPGSSTLVPAPGASQLSALGSALKLSEALLADRAIAVRGSLPGRVVGLLLLFLGLALLVMERRSNFLGGTAVTLAGLSLLAVAGLLAAAGAIVFCVFLAVPTTRRLAVRLAASQAEEWTSIQAQTRNLTLQVQVGVALGTVGFLVAALAYAAASEVLAPPLAASGVLVATAGLILALAAASRRTLARRLYVQTLVLSGLERTGFGATDTRVAPVLLALDELLGALPADQVKSFLASPQAQAYLDLIDEAGRSHGK